MSLVVAKGKTPSDVFTDPEVKRKLVKRRRRSRKADLGLQSFFNIRSRCKRESAAVIYLLWQRTSADGKGSYQVWTSFLANTNTKNYKTVSANTNTNTNTKNYKNVTANTNTKPQTANINTTNNCSIFFSCLFLPCLAFCISIHQNIIFFYRDFNMRYILHYK